jgi:hypothetical protein
VAVLYQDAVHVAVWGGADPAEKLLFGLDGVVEIDPVRVVVSVLGAFGVDDLLDDLLRGLRVRERKRERQDGQGGEMSGAKHALRMPEAGKGFGKIRAV